MSLYKTRSLLCLFPHSSHHDSLVRITAPLHRRRLRFSRDVEKNRHRTPSQRVPVPRSGDQTPTTPRPRGSGDQSTRSHRQTARHRLQPPSRKRHPWKKGCNVSCKPNSKWVWDSFKKIKTHHSSFDTLFIFFFKQKQSHTKPWSSSSPVNHAYQASECLGHVAIVSWFGPHVQLASANSYSVVQGNISGHPRQRLVIFTSHTPVSKLYVSCIFDPQPSHFITDCSFLPNSPHPSQNMSSSSLKHSAKLPHPFFGNEIVSFSYKTKKKKKRPTHPRQPNKNMFLFFFLFLQIRLSQVRHHFFFQANEVVVNVHATTLLQRLQMIVQTAVRPSGNI